MNSCLLQPPPPAQGWRVPCSLTTPCILPGPTQNPVTWKPRVTWLLPADARTQSGTAGQATLYHQAAFLGQGIQTPSSVVGQEEPPQLMMKPHQASSTSATSGIGALRTSLFILHSSPMGRERTLSSADGGRLTHQPVSSPGQGAARKVSDSRIHLRPLHGPQSGLLGARGIGASTPQAAKCQGTSSGHDPAAQRPTLHLNCLLSALRCEALTRTWRGRDFTPLSTPWASSLVSLVSTCT